MTGPFNPMSFFSRLLSRRQRAPIERLLERATRSERHRAAFYRGLLTEVLWVPGTIDGGAVFVQPFDLDGRRTILIFSSERRLDEALRKHSGAISVPGRILLEALPHYDTVVLDYATRLQKELMPTEIVSLLDGSIFDLIRDDHAVRRTVIGRPKHYPMQLLDALRPVLERHIDVRRAYLCQTQDEGATEAVIVIGLETGADGAHGSFNNAVDEVARCVASVDVTMRVIAMGGDAASEFMRRETEPWYPAPDGGLFRSPP